MNMSELDFVLPPELIATHPAHPRDASRLMVVHTASGKVEHRTFRDLSDLLVPTDLLVLNDTRVLPARLNFKRPTGAEIPGLFVHEIFPGRWEVMLRSRGKISPGDPLLTGNPEISCTVESREADRGHWIISLIPALPAAELLEKIGHVPLPPYIEKARRTENLNPADAEAIDRTEYQTVYAHDPGSLAAPTAGLHFTPDVFSRLSARGIRRANVTLHVGLGTFLPVETETLESHKMHSERYWVPLETITALRAQRLAGHRIVTVGTTATRTVESAASEILAPTPPESPLSASTTLCISPGYAFQLTDILLTNFHLPRSTLLALVAALVGLDRLHSLYALAIREKYRFYSYGDAMLILP